VHEDAVLLEATLPRVMRVLFRHDGTDPLGHLSLSQLRMVRALQREDRSAVDLSLELGMSQSAVSQTLHRLEAMELIERRLDDHDARVRLVGLSEQGERLLRERQSLRVARAEEVLRELSGTHRRELLESLERLARLCEPKGSEPLSLVAELEQTMPLNPPYAPPKPKTR
jgi:DNA-binding MarR family transcriptional regulator